MKTVSCLVNTQVSVTFPLQHRCPFVDEVDTGTVTLVWGTEEGLTLELHSLREYLDAFKGDEISHEELTHLIAEDLKFRVPVISVTSTWETAGGQVTVTVTRDDLLR